MGAEETEVSGEKFLKGRANSGVQGLVGEEGEVGRKERWGGKSDDGVWHVGREAVIERWYVGERKGMPSS